MFKKFCWFVFFIGISVLIYDILRFSYAYSYDDDKLHKLFYSSDINYLNDNILKYVFDVDDIIMVTATYEDSDVLIQNYSFLTDFAIEYIFQHSDLFLDDIIVGEDYEYYNLNGEKKVTNQYVKSDAIYFVTEWFFGIKDYYIDEDSFVYDSLIPLTNKYVYKFDYSIKSVSSVVSGDYVKSNIIYDNDFKCCYTFYVKNSVLKIQNVEVIL